ncbi:MAG: monovalent cation/H(+) antiporter subunit G [Rhodospirillales bacterium]|nr:monovalent cation/H(+) antiporter subunit G [Rhodospirillales bacterium]
MALAIDILVWTLLLTGGAFGIIGGIGILRLPDVYTRLHGAGITDTLGAGLSLLGLTVYEGFTLIAVKLVLIFIFLVLTSPVSSYALADAAFGSGLRPILHNQRQKPKE